MKCVGSCKTGGTFRTSDRHAQELMLGLYHVYVSKAQWKADGRKREGPQDGAPSSIHPRKGWGGKKKGKW